MAKKSNRRLQYRKDQAGCIWGFISMFDFRHGRATRKLLSNRRHLTRPNLGAGCTVSQLQMLTNFSANTQQLYDGEERGSLRADSFKASSVKELMEEEMFSEPDPKKQMDSVEVELRRDMKRGSRRNSRTSKTSCDFHYDVDGAKQNILGNLDLEAVLKELCEQIHERSTSCTKHDGNNDLDIDVQSDHKGSVFDENLIEAVKVLVGERFTDSKDSKIHHSKEFVDALQTLSSNKELLSDLLKDPNSLLVKHIENLEEAHLDSDKNSISSSKSNQNESQEPLPAPPKHHHNLFWRRSKSQDKNLSKGEEKSRTLSSIVILRPGLPNAQVSEAKTPLQEEATVSHFSFSEMKRKLRHAMGRDRPTVDSGDKGKGRWISPNKDRFYKEKFTRPAIGEPKETDTSIGKETVASPKKRGSNIYVEGRKHLSELMSNGCESEEFSSTRSPKTLGKILLLPEFNFSPICSPRIEKEHSFRSTEQTTDNRSQVVNEILGQLSKESRFSLLGSPRESSNSLPYNSEMQEEKVQICDAQSDGNDENNLGNTCEDTLCSIEVEETSKVHLSFAGDLVDLQTIDAFDLEESKLLDITTEENSSSGVRDEENSDPAEVSKEEELAECSELDSNEHAKLLSSPSTPTQASSGDKHHGDPESSSGIPERTSPVSVLEPLFTEEEDDISPASFKSVSVEPATHQMLVPYNEQPSSKEICIGTSPEDEESPFEYVEAVLLSSDLNWDEFLSRWLSSDPILDPSLFDEVGLFSSRSSHDQRLLFDCTNEVLKEVCERYFSFVKNNIRPVPQKKDLIDEVWEGVEWHLRPMPSPRTLEQIVRKDLSRNGSWMDLRSDIEKLSIEIGEAILEELVTDIFG